MPGLISLVVRTDLYVCHDVIVHHGPAEVPPHKLDRLLLTEVSDYFAIVFGFEICRDHLPVLGNVEASSVVEYVV